MKKMIEGQYMHGLARELFPYCRSLTGNGVRQTLSHLKRELPELQTYEVPTGTRALDWTVPDEWNIKDAYVLNSKGERVIDFKKNNLHVIGHCAPFEGEVSREELDQHLHSIPEMPEVIPYLFSFYERRWGLCVKHSQRLALTEKSYRVKIDATLEPGHLTYADLVIPGETKEEIFVSTYICHPSMANNELSGPVLSTALAQWVKQQKNRRFTYRFIFIPETIGAIIYLSRHLQELKKNVRAGFVLTCVGDERTYSYMPSRLGNTLADQVALHTLKYLAPQFKSYSFVHHRGSDERQYCSPGVDLPVCSVMRSRYGDFPEYHSSADDLETVVTPRGLQGSFDFYRSMFEILESNVIYQSLVLGEPQLGKRNLYSSFKYASGTPELAQKLLNFLAYADGQTSVLEIAQKIDLFALELKAVIEILLRENLIKKV